VLSTTVGCVFRLRNTLMSAQATNPNEIKVTTMGPVLRWLAISATTLLTRVYALCSALRSLVIRFIGVDALHHSFRRSLSTVCELLPMLDAY
jgi:hypothetical protein